MNGGLVLSAEISRYHEACAAFDMPGLDEYFNFLKELANLYIADPQNIQICLKEGRWILL